MFRLCSLNVIGLILNAFSTPVICGNGIQKSFLARYHDREFRSSRFVLYFEGMRTDNWFCEK